MSDRNLQRQTATGRPPLARTEEIVDLSREFIARGSKSFAGAALMFDRRTRASVYMLYAWCRTCDDAVDGQEWGFRPVGTWQDQEHKVRRLAEIGHETERAFAGDAVEPDFIGLGHVVERHRIPHRYPLAMLDGFRMDVDGRRYQQLDDLLEYCHHVAGVVGIMMATIMGVRSRPHLQRACDLGIAFQLTNIARDVIADREVGRIYLPLDWLAESGLDPETLTESSARPRLFEVVTRLLDTADDYYHSAAGGLPALPFRSAWAVATARAVYRDIGGEVRWSGPAAWNGRASVGRLRKLWGAARGLGAALDAMTLGQSRALPPRRALWTPPELRTDPVAAPAPQLHYRRPVTVGGTGAGLPTENAAGRSALLERARSP